MRIFGGSEGEFSATGAGAGPAGMEVVISNEEQDCAETGMASSHEIEAGTVPEALQS